MSVSIGWQADRVASRVPRCVLLPVPFLIGQANAAAVHLVVWARIA